MKHVFVFLLQAEAHVKNTRGKVAHDVDEFEHKTQKMFKEEKF